MATKNTPHYSPSSFFVVRSSKFDASKEILLSVTRSDEGRLPYFERYDWQSTLSEKHLTQLKICYNIPASIYLEVLSHGVIDSEGYMSRVIFIVLSPKWPLTFVYPSSACYIKFSSN